MVGQTIGAIWKCYFKLLKPVRDNFTIFHFYSKQIIDQFIKLIYKLIVHYGPNNPKYE